jgi:D-arabinan exo alpha-(1,3)/(1,5)-arabinofuranosidase (non-reducing end)
VALLPAQFVRGRDWSALRARGRGVMVGIAHSMRGPRSRRYLEGDERVVADGRLVIHGTGTEDFYEGGWYFNRGTFTRPFTGHPAHRLGGPLCPAADCTAAYRLMIADSIPFSNSLRFSFEHGNRNRVRALYGTTAYWYG